MRTTGVDPRNYVKSVHLLVRVDVYVALDAFLAHIGPAVTRHPFALALGTLVLAEASFFPLVRRQTFALRPRL